MDVDRYALDRTTAPTVEPVTLVQAKAQCRVDGTADDTFIGELIEDARDMVEDYLGQALLSQTWKLYLDWFPDWEICVPRPPLISVSSIAYVDSDGVSQTLSALLYQVDAKSRPGRIWPAYGETWPVAREQLNAVTITYVAGYGTTAATVPQKIRRAVLLTVGDWYENREQIITGTIVAELPTGAERLLSLAGHGSYQ